MKRSARTRSIPFIPGSPRSATTQPILFDRERLLDRVSVPAPRRSKPGAGKGMVMTVSRSGSSCTMRTAADLWTGVSFVVDLVSWTRQWCPPSSVVSRRSGRGDITLASRAATRRGTCSERALPRATVKRPPSGQPVGVDESQPIHDRSVPPGLGFQLPQDASGHLAASPDEGRKVRPREAALIADEDVGMRSRTRPTRRQAPWYRSPSIRSTTSSTRQEHVPPEGRPQFRRRRRQRVHVGSRPQPDTLRLSGLGAPPWRGGRAIGRTARDLRATRCSG